MRKMLLAAVAAALSIGVALSTRAADQKAAEAQKPAEAQKAAEKKPAAAGLKIGDAVPNFTLKDQDGNDVNLADLKGKTVVLEWLNPGCPFVVRHYKEGTFQKLYDKYSGKDVVYLGIQSGSGTTPEKNKAFAEKNGLKYKILADTDATVAKALGAKTTPHMFIITKDQTLGYRGAIDDDPQGNKGEARVNFVDQGLTQILAGETVTNAENKSYGCGVKTK